MKHKLTFVILFFSFNLVISQPYYFPPADNADWEHLSPDSLNWCADSIQALYDFLETEQTKSFVVLKDGKVVLEKYFGSYTQDSLWFWFSAGKSLRSVLVGIAQEEGYLNIHDRSADYLGEGWTSLPSDKEDSITIWHQLTMTSGLDETEFFCTDPECLTYVADAGTRWYYHNSPYNLLRDVLEEATGQGINIYTNSRVKNKIEMNSGFWLPIGYNTFFLSTALDMARFGLLILNEGVWNGTTVLGDSEYFEQMTNSSQNLNPSYGYLWWLNGKESYIPPSTALSFDGPIAPDAPADVVLAAGSQGQYISVSPSEGMVVVRQGTSADDDLAAVNLHNDIWARISNLECAISSTHSVIASELSVYPNPSTGLFYIHRTKGQELDAIRLYDTRGNQVKVYESAATYSLDNLPDGIYFLEVEMDGKQYFHKLIKQ